jgi:hypothetical protein
MPRSNPKFDLSEENIRSVMGMHCGLNAILQILRSDSPRESKGDFVRGPIHWHAISQP